MPDEGESRLDMEDPNEADVRRVPPTGYVAAGMVGLIGLGILGWMIYRGVRRRTLVERLQDALPDRVRKLPARMKKVRSG